MSNIAANAAAANTNHGKTAANELFRPEDFRHHIQIEIRFADLDAIGHVYHATYLTYMEQGRIHYLRDVFGWQGDVMSIGLVVARLEIDYRASLFMNDTVHVATRCSRMGNKSFDWVYLLRREKDGAPDEIVATALTTVVHMDYKTRVSLPVPQHWRERYQQFEVGAPL